MHLKIIQVIIALLAVVGNTSSFAQLPQEIDLNKDWQLIWSDEFDYPDAQLETNWTSQNGASNHILCSRWRENAEVHDGILELKAKKESRGGQDWTCGNVWTKEKFGYGYFECRYKYAGATGTNNSFWTWTTYNIPEGQKAIELDINEGHYPNIVNTNIHNWSDKHEDGSHDIWPEKFLMGGIEMEPSYTHILDTSIITNKIRFSSTHGPHFHIGEFRIYAPNAAGYPQNATSDNADSEVPGLENYTREDSTIISASGQYMVEGRNTDPRNVADGLNRGSSISWIAPSQGEKWLEITLSEAKEIGCIQFTNGWYGSGKWNALISNYKLEYHDGEKWVELTAFDIADGADFSEEFHTYGMLWNENEVSYYFDGELLRTFQHDFIHAKTHIYLSLAILKNNYAGAVTDAIDGTSMKIDYVRYYSINSATGINDFEENEIRVYPNPANDKLYFDEDYEFRNVKIFNLYGQILQQKSLNETNYLNIEQLPPGLYCYVIEGQYVRKTGKFFKN